MDISPFIFKQDDDGNTYAVNNPEWQKYVQNEKYNLFLRKSGIPEFYYDISFKDYVGNIKSDEYRKIVYYAEHCDEKKFDHVHLYLWGDKGCQKTSLMCNIGKTAIKKGLKVKFVLAGDLIDSLMKLQGYSNNEELYNYIEDLKTNYNLILLDDAGDVEKSMMWKTESRNLIITEWDKFFRKVLYNGTKLIITSNFDVTIFKQYFSDSIYEMLDRNMEKIHLIDSVKQIRQLNVQSAFEGMN